MKTEEFKRETSRTFVVAAEWSVIVALCGVKAHGETLKHFFKKETEAGKIVVVLSETSSPDLNTNKIALADELFILNPGGNYDDFQAEMYLTAEKLGKHIRVLKP